MTERYEVLSRLGSGGMATVLLCRDERLGRRVAVKRLHADSPVDVERRFLREAKLGASLNHPGLVSIYDTETDDEGLLIVMEYVEGESLAEALARGPLPPRRVAEIARELGEALDHVHAHGVVHRDVKPANVLLRRDGAVKLVDLGIAVSMDQTRVTRSGTVLGSAAYMAPEQLEGGEIGPAADVYALAAVCFEALAGRKARTGRTPVEIAHSVATTPPPDLRELAPELPAEVADVLARGMARRPEDRPDSAGELAEELRLGLQRPVPERTAATRRLAALTEGGAARSAPAAPMPAPVAPAAAPPASRRRSRSLAIAAVGLAAAAVVAAIVLAVGGGGDGSPADKPSDGAKAQAPAKTKKAPKQTAKRDNGPAQGAPADQTAQQPPDKPASDRPAPAPRTPAQPGGVDPARGVALNTQGFDLMREGDYAGAVPILMKAVASWPKDSTDLDYAYALYNLGASLNRSGNPSAAIPFLFKRMQWSDQRGVVKRELRDAQRNARG